LGAIHQKVLTGNNTGTHAREKLFPRFNEDGKKVGTKKKTFLLVVASSRDIEPDEHKNQGLEARFDGIASYHGWYFL
jgi:hypothetical protein